jgi:hypothetical protein
MDTQQEHHDLKRKRNDEEGDKKKEDERETKIPRKETDNSTTSSKKNVLVIVHEMDNDLFFETTVSFGNIIRKIMNLIMPLDKMHLMLNPSFIDPSDSTRGFLVEKSIYPDYFCSSYSSVIADENGVTLKTSGSEEEPSDKIYNIIDTPEANSLAAMCTLFSLVYWYAPDVQKKFGDALKRWSEKHGLPGLVFDESEPRKTDDDQFYKNLFVSRDSIFPSEYPEMLEKYSYVIHMCADYWIEDVALHELFGIVTNIELQ